MCGTPSWTKREAKWWRRSCQRNFAMLARLRSFAQAVLNPVLTSKMRRPPFVCSRQRLSRPIASSFKGTWRVWRFFAVPPSTVRIRRLKSMDSHRSARSSPRRSPVFMERITAGVRWSPKWGREGSNSFSRSWRHALAEPRAARIWASRALSAALSRDSYC